MHEKTGPGKLTDFVPEVERNAKKEDEKRDFSYRRASDEEPRLIRNYDLPPAVTTTTKVPSTTMSAPLSSRRQEDDSVSAVLKRSTLPRNVLHPISENLQALIYSLDKECVVLGNNCKSYCMRLRRG
ncbi:unnamed protein product [Strongylus vulgaris]|uniref:Uncharacterized protein n=1 Tax=Strongylus vulgaris TaxID=40348 RepID=A0A3P7K2K1_STRVU|nr:unnamed protein product [Strongylus vulgaris]